MSRPQEHDYIGLSEVSSMGKSDKISSSSSSSASSLTCSEEENKNKNKNSTNSLNLKETELRLGLPGSESPERKVVVGGGGAPATAYSLGVLKNLVSGSKRGFSDAIDVSGKWGFVGSSGGDMDLGKGGVLFSPRGLSALEKSGSQQQASPAPVIDVPPPATLPPPAEKKPQASGAPASKAQVVGWPPIRSFRKNTMTTKNNDDAGGKAGVGCLYVKVSMDGAPYLRKVDLKTYSNYVELSSALEKMFSCFTLGQYGSHGVPGREGLTESRLMDLLHGSEYVLTYEDKDGDWMLVGDVPWEMFTDSCKRLRIMKGSEAIGLAPRAMEKCKNRN